MTMDERRVLSLPLEYPTPSSMLTYLFLPEQLGRSLATLTCYQSSYFLWPVRYLFLRQYRRQDEGRIPTWGKFSRKSATCLQNLVHSLVQFEELFSEYADAPEPAKAGRMLNVFHGGGLSI